MSWWGWSSVQAPALKMLKVVQRALSRDAAAPHPLAPQATSILTLSLLFGPAGHDPKREG